VNPLVPIILGVVGAAISAVGAYALARRQRSGKVDTTEAATLWAEGQAMRKELRDETIVLRDEGVALRLEAIAMREEAAVMRAELLALRTESVGLRAESAAMREEMVVSRVESVALREETMACRKEVIVLRKRLESAMVGRVFSDDDGPPDG
jgi:hypothetical protein